MGVRISAGGKIFTSYEDVVTAVEAAAAARGDAQVGTDGSSPTITITTKDGEPFKQFSGKSGDAAGLMDSTPASRAADAEADRRREREELGDRSTWELPDPTGTLDPGVQTSDADSGDGTAALEDFQGVDVGAGVPTTFRGVMGDYDPKGDKLPQNTTQAYAAIAYANTLAIGVTQDTDGTWRRGGKTMQPTNEREEDGSILEGSDTALIRDAVRREQLLGAADSILGQDVDQMAGAGQLELDKSLANTKATLDSQLQRDLAALQATNAAALQAAQAASAVDLAGVRGTEERASIGAQAAEARTAQTAEFAQREKELILAHQNDTALILARAAQERQTLERQRDLQLTVLEYTNDLQIAMQSAAQAFQAQEAQLDRHLAQQEIDEAITARQSMNLLEAEQLRIQDAQLKMSFVSMIAQSPEFIFHARQSGILGSMGDFLGDGGELMRQMDSLVEATSRTWIKTFADGREQTKVVSPGAEEEARRQGFKPQGSAPSQLLNVQQLGRLTDIEQRQEAFRSRALQGGTSEDFVNRLRGQAPRVSTGSRPSLSAA